MMFWKPKDSAGCAVGNESAMGPTGFSLLSFVRGAARAEARGSFDSLTTFGAPRGLQVRGSSCLLHLGEHHVQVLAGQAHDVLARGLAFLGLEGGRHRLPAIEEHLRP